MTAQHKKLVALALKARTKAYAPYSKFKVGAALEASDGTIYTGCNVENASYSVTCCAERVALFKAVADGKKKFRRIAVVGSTKNPTPPCGVCRQALIEFAPRLEVVMANPVGDIEIESLATLLAHPIRVLK